MKHLLEVYKDKNMTIRKLIQEKLDDAVANAIREALKEIPRKVKDQINAIVAKSFGFDNKWGGEWQVDHCNSRKSSLGNLIVGKAKAEISKDVEEFLDKTKFKINNQQKQAIKKDAHDTYMREFKRKLHEAVEKKATDEAEELAKALVPDLKTLDLDLKAMADPSFGETEREKLVIEMHLEEHEKDAPKTP